MLSPIPAFFRINLIIKVVISTFLLALLFIPCENKITPNVSEIYFIFSTLNLLRTITMNQILSTSEEYFYKTEEIVYQ